MIRLLVVDDAPFVREVVRHAVKRTTGEPIEIVGEAEDGLEAIEKARELRPDVILMDIVLPKLNGLDASREIISKSADVRIVAFSTNDSESMIVNALDAGCVSFIQKPFQAKELVEAIEQAAKRKLKTAKLG